MNHLYKTIIAIGSNLGDREANIRFAIDKISAEIGSLIAASTFYSTAPIGDNAKNMFINGAILIETELMPEAQMLTLLSIEESLGRERKVKWGDRTIDLDIVSIEKDGTPLEIKSNILNCPHPQTEYRDFVVVPVSEVYPEGLFLPKQMTFLELKKSKNFKTLCKAFEL